MIEEALIWISLPFRVAYGLIRDEIEFYRIVRHHIKNKPFKDVEF